MRRTDLSTAAGAQWELRAGDGPLPGHLQQLRHHGVAATVPGEVHTDLLAAGLVPDPFDGDHESLLAWVGRTDWSWTARFEADLGDELHHELVAEGLDTVARLVLNGTEVARTANHHRTHRVDVTGVLRQGANELRVEVSAPVPAAEAARDLLGARPQVNHHPYNALRKTACSFGWDWGIDVATSGVWRPVRVESWSGARLASVRPLGLVEDGEPVLEVRADVVLDPGGPAGAGAALRVVVGDREVTVPVTSTAEVVRLPAPGAALWWPRGHGDPALHEARVELLVGGAPVDAWSGRVGFRTVELDQSPDDLAAPLPGGGRSRRFQLRVNGEDVHVRGANWIPDDALLTRVDDDDVRRALDDTCEAGLNLLRVWGGGLYESEAFYRACDERGVLVWQDFLLACAAYAEEEPLRSEVEAEAREAVSRLSAHASLALWCGGNENLWGFEDWGWKEELAGRSWGEGYYRELFPAVVAELDPRTPYVPGSPFSPDPGVHPNDPAQGPVHEWEVWNRQDQDRYRDLRPRFVSEFGFQGPPAWSTLTAVVHDEPLDPYGPQMLVHQKAEDGNGKLERGLGEHLPRWRDVEEWHWATQLNQARAVALGLEHWRSLHPLCSGAVVWQLNDSWPVVSWALVDSAGIRKPVWYAVQRASAEVLLTLQPRDGRPALCVHADSAHGWTGRVRLVRVGTGPGSPVLGEAVLDVVAAARSAVELPLPDAVAVSRDERSEVLVAAAEGAAGPRPALWRWAETARLRLVAPHEALTATARAGAAPGTVLVTVTARALLEDVCLFPDRLDAGARVDSGMVSLLAGQQHVFTVTTSRPWTAAELARACAAPVLRCSNDLLAPRG
ncbi:glycoside hydrolase family 2 protein [Quadrisphaera sp. KR29]|uniref:glycoside hydrolase family 2 protein n=1 Tax=Quadrisphaera sp. KR29 TaxID=3461391 RepID=UPI0040448ED1